MRHLIRVLLIAILPHLSSLVIASERDSAIEFQQLLEFSGVGAHLDNVNTNVKLEAGPLLKQCAPRKEISDVLTVLDAELSPTSLRKLYIKELSERLSVDELDEIMNWKATPAAMRIAEVDRLSGELTEVQFNALQDRFNHSAGNTRQRIKLVREVIKHTGAVYFLSAMNTEVSALVETAGTCESDDETVQALQNRLVKIRVDETFYRAMMRSDVVQTSAVIYQEVSNEDLQALVNFAVSDAGKSYHTALIQGARHLLQQRNNRVQQLLFTANQ